MDNTIDNISLIKSELITGVPIGLVGNYINVTIMEQLKKKVPERLFHDYWYEGEICCLFSDSNTGKSVLAVQIASEISKKQTVIYFDFELSDKQFQMRYTEKSIAPEYPGVPHVFPDKLMRFTIDPERLDINRIDDQILEGIERVAVANNSKILVIDNLTYICANSEKSDAAGRLMMSLMKLKKQYDWSILVIAHTPKRSMSNPITQNDLAGSKKLLNFFDGAFAIGLSAKDESLRYVKMIKNRNTSFSNTAVRLYSIVKERGYLHFKFEGESTEREHLKEVTEEDEEKLNKRIIYLKDQGKSYREIAKETGVSLGKVQRTLSRLPGELEFKEECKGD